MAGTRAILTVPCSDVRAPTTWSQPSSSFTSRGISLFGYVMSTSVHTTIRPCAACVPALRAEPLPRFWANWMSRMPSIWRSASPEPSFEPSSTTMIS